VQVIVTTATLEEGIDIPTCNLVVSYDGVKQEKSYIQMRGRCRVEEGGRFVVFSLNGTKESKNLERSKHTEREVANLLNERRVNQQNSDGGSESISDDERCVGLDAMMSRECVRHTLGKCRLLPAQSVSYLHQAVQKIAQGSNAKIKREFSKLTMR
jgi:ERCC4-related helicase